MIQAIETRYKGHRFRSRLEARWAVFFDALGIRYEYEFEGFRINDMCNERRSWFYLPDFYLPDLGTWVEVKGSLELASDDYLSMIANAVDWNGCLPGISDSSGTCRGLLWLQSIPKENICNRGAPTHVIFQHCKGGWINLCNWFGSNFEITGYEWEYFDSTWGDDKCARTIRLHLSEVLDWHHLDRECPQNVRKAYRLAREARFERW